MSAWDHTNRRKSPRIHYPCQITIKSPQKGPIPLLTHTENIGPGGVGLLTKNSFQLYVMVSVELDLMDYLDPLRCEGKVVWCFRREAQSSDAPALYDVGIEFMNMSERDRERLRSCVRKLEQRKDVQYD